MDCRRAVQVIAASGLVFGASVMTVRGQAVADSDGQVLRLGEMVVVESMTERDLVANPWIESAGLEIAISTVDEETIQRENARTLTDAIDFATGVLTESRGRKIKQISSFRGQIYPYPDYALNGIWQNEFPQMPYIFPASQIEEVELLRSSGALLLGLSDITGVINVITKRYDEQTTFMQAEYGGRFNTCRTSIAHGDASDKGFYTVGVNYTATDGPDDENAAARMFSGVATAGYQVSPELWIEGSFYHLRGENELRNIQAPANLNWRREGEIGPFDVLGGSARAQLKHSEDASTELTLGYFERTSDYSEEQFKKGAWSWASHHGKDYEFYAGLMHARNLSENNTLRVGTNYNYWFCPDGKRNFVGKRMDIHTIAGVIVDEHRFDRLTLDVGFKSMWHYYNDYSPTLFDINGDNNKGARITDEWSDPLLTATFGAKYELTEIWSLYGHLAAGMLDAPVGGVTVTGENLEDEHRVMLDAGAKAEKAGLGYVKVGAFVTFRENASSLDDTTDDDVSVYSNNDLRQYGLEIEARSAKIREMVELYVSATIMDSEVRDGGWDDFIEIPDHIISGGVYIQRGPIDVNLFGKYVSGYENYRFAADGAYHDLGAFTDLNLTAGYSFGSNRSTRIYCSLENLLDDHYSTVLGYPENGFEAFFGIQHEL